MIAKNSAGHLRRSTKRNAAKDSPQGNQTVRTDAIPQRKYNRATSSQRPELTMESELNGFFSIDLGMSTRLCPINDIFEIIPLWSINHLVLRKRGCGVVRGRGWGVETVNIRR